MVISYDIEMMRCTSDLRMELEWCLFSCGMGSCDGWLFSHFAYKVCICIFSRRQSSNLQKILASALCTIKIHFVVKILFFTSSFYTHFAILVFAIFFSYVCICYNEKIYLCLRSNSWSCKHPYHTAQQNNSLK